MVNPLNYRSLPIRVFLIASILLQATFCAIRWKALLTDPGLNGIDFISFYTAGRIARSEGYARLYDVQAQNDFQDQLIPEQIYVGGEELSHQIPYLHPPYLAPILSIISGKNYIDSYVIWTEILILMLIICSSIIYAFLLSSGWDRDSAILYALNSICFYPVLLSILKGQDTAFILFGLLLWMYGLLLNKDLLSGVGLALSSLFLPIAGALALPTLSARRRCGFWFCLAFLILIIFSLSMVGVAGGFDFIKILILSSQGQGYALNQSKMFNFLGLMIRSFPGLNLNLIHELTWVLIIVSLIGSTWLWWGKKNNINVVSIGLIVVLATFTSPHLHAHSLSFLLLPLLGVSIYFFKRSNRLAQIAAVTLVPLCSLMMEASNIAGDTGLYLSAYLLMAALAGWFIYFLCRRDLSLQ
jgi:hypothetical protein